MSAVIFNVKEEKFKPSTVNDNTLSGASHVTWLNPNTVAVCCGRLQGQPTKQGTYIQYILSST